MPEIELGPWETPFADRRLAIVDVVYGNGGVEIVDHRRDRRLRVPPSREVAESELRIRALALDDGSLYSVRFARVTAFRLLDEGGLLELWTATEALGGRPARTTFRARGHSWSRESPIPFEHAGGWSYVLATDNECVEVLSDVAPAIALEQRVEPTPGTRTE